MIVQLIFIFAPKKMHEIEFDDVNPMQETIDGQNHPNQRSA